MNKINVHYTEKRAHYTLASYLKDIITDDTIFVCIGTDRCIGDSLGPLVGTMLKENEVFPLSVYGTLLDPIHALNINYEFRNIQKKHPNSKIIAIDASLDDSNNIGGLQIRNCPIYPGVGVRNRSLPAVGDSSIIGIVDSVDNRRQFGERNIRLNLLFEMAKIITMSIVEGYNLHVIQGEKTG